MNQPAYKKLDELSFSDLYIEQDDQEFPYLREAFDKLFTKLRSRKAKRNNTAYIRDEQQASSYYVTDTFTFPPINKLKPRY